MKLDIERCLVLFGGGDEAGHGGHVGRAAVGVQLHRRHYMQNWQEDVEGEKRRQARMNKTNLGVWLEVLLKNSVSSFTLESNIISLQEARPEMDRSHTRAIKNELKDEGDSKKKRGLKINKGRDAKRQALLFHCRRWPAHCKKWIIPCLRELT